LLFVYYIFISVSDSIRLARNLSYAVIKFDNEMYGVSKYMCEAKNKHGFTNIFINVIIPGLIFCENNSFFVLIYCIDTQIKLILSYNDVQSRSVVLNWHLSNERYNRFNHFIIYYRCLYNFNESTNEEEEMINIQDYKQVLVDPRTTNYSFTFHVREKLNH